MLAEKAGPRVKGSVRRNLKCDKYFRLDRWKWLVLAEDPLEHRAHIQQ